RGALWGALSGAATKPHAAGGRGQASLRSTPPAGAKGGVYWLGVRGCSGPEALVGPIQVDASAGAGGLALSVSPNPAAGGTSFEFALDRAADARLEIFDLAGRRGATPLSGRPSAGAVRAGWNLKDVAGRAVEPGLYFARLQTLGRTFYARVTVVAP